MKQRSTFIHKLVNQMKLYQIENEGVQLCRVGNFHGGGYVMAGDFESYTPIAYSFGIEEDVSWDKQMAEEGFDVFMYDHTIDHLVETHEKFHWSKIGIASDYSKVDDLKTLDELMKKNGHEEKEHMILKMDVEGCEWGFLFMVSSETLSRFDQIVFELHSMDELDILHLLALNKLNQTHAMVHIHYNNYARMDYIDGIPILDAIEVTYVKRDRYILKSSEIDLPLEIDGACVSEVEEIRLGKWNRFLE